MSFFGYRSVLRNGVSAHSIIEGFVQLCSRSCVHFWQHFVDRWNPNISCNISSPSPFSFTIGLWENGFGMGRKGQGGFYAVAKGRSVGIYNTWDECKAQVDGFNGSRFKKFGSQAEAQAFINEKGSGEPSNNGLVQQPANQRPTSEPTRRFFPQMSGVKSAASNFLGPSALQARASVPTVAASSSGSSIQKRQFSTTKPLDKRRIPVTDDRVVNKRARMDGEDNAGVDLKKFLVDSNGYIKVFTDGACSKNGFKGARAGIGVWFGDHHELNISEPVQGRATNNTAEIQAAEKAIRQAKAKGITKLNVNTDSQFVIKCVTEWMDKWQRNGWKLAGGKPVVNQTDLENLNSAAAGMNIKWTYVPGHKGDYGNEAADRLAVAGAARY